MPPPQRPRACEPCHAIKIKCELGSTGGAPPCERCVRLGKDCQISKPRRNKDRVAELEAKVEALTRMLEAQGISPQDSSTSSNQESSTKSIPSSTSSNSFSKKRRLGNGDALDVQTPDEGVTRGSVSESPRFNDEGISIRLDYLVPMGVQRQIIDKYVNIIMPKYPFVQLAPGTTLESLRKTKPLLCQAIISTQGPEYLPDEAQEELIVVMMNVYANAIISAGDKSLEVVQAIQIAVGWFNSPRTHKHVNVYQLIHISADMAADIGIGGRSFNPIPKTITNESFEPDPQCFEARRAWLVCYLLSASITINMRRPSSSPWTSYHDECLVVLEGPDNPSPHDALLCSIIRGEKLCEGIALAVSLTDMQSYNDIGDPILQYVIKDQQLRINTWRAQIPNPAMAKEVFLWDALAVIHLNEPVLHTPTNKTSFAGPFLAERLAEDDFPKPNPITSQHVRSLLALKDTTQALLDNFASLPPDSMLSEPSLIYLPRGAFSFYILMKLYIAVAGPGNTLSAAISPADLDVETYIAKMRSIASRAHNVHGVFVQKKILMVVDRIRDWFVAYNSRLGIEIRAAELYDGEPGVSAASLSANGYATMPPPTSGLQADEGLDAMAFGWDDFLALPDDGQGLDFGFGDLFAEPYEGGMYSGVG